MLTHILSLLRPRAAPAPEVPPSIDPDGVFHDDGAWNAPDARLPVAWEIVTGAGTVSAEAHGLEIVDGALHLLDLDDDVILALEPGRWERVRAAAPVPDIHALAHEGDLPILNAA